MRARLPAAVTTATMLAATLSGCMTVHGATAVVPAVGKAEAAKVLEHFSRTNNEANEAYDAELNATIEGGALGAIDQAGLRARKKVHPEGSGSREPLELTDARFLIPRQAGWPKSFVADTASNRSDDGRWFLVFQRDSADAAWKADYLAVLSPDETPRFAVGKDGYAEAVPTDDAGLAIAPGKISEAYTGYLQNGGEGFAPGPHTSEWREQREENAEQPGVRTQWADLPAQDARFTPFGLRTEDGGALVFFASHHQKKQTVAKGYTPKVEDPYVDALLTGEPRESITYVRMSQQAVTVPPAKDDGDAVFVSRIAGLTKARGT